jgi:ABC-type multidrug transport system fused ATPase/permease subunit
MSILSLIKRVQPKPQTSRAERIQREQEKDGNKLPLTELWIILCVALIGFIALCAIAYWRITEHSFRIGFLVSSALVFFTLLAIVFQAVVYRRQWHAMRDSLKQTEKMIGKMQGQLAEVRQQTEIMKTSLSHTEALVKHTEQGIKVAERNTRYAQRAYVTVTKREAIETGFWLTIENSGNTPALDVTVMHAADAGFAAPAMPTWDGGTYISVGMLAPRETYRFFIPYGRTIRADEAEYFNDPKWEYNWWCIGQIFYRDIFQSDLIDYRETLFSYCYDRKRQLVQAGSPSENQVKEKYSEDEK